jgi:4'-phosphopantetheinyl transferase
MLDGVDVHFFSLDMDPGRLRELEALLAPDECERAGRFRLERDRERFIACRGTLREILGVSAGLPFAYNRFGKPRLAASDIRFNVSHAHGMAMIAMTRGRELGCDLEWIDPAFVDDNIPEQFFSPYEVASLRALPAENQCHAFFRCWTRKEAYIKACGMGVSLALDSFDVTLAPDQPPVLLRGADGWTLYNIDAPAGYMAALVLENQPPRTMRTSSFMSSITKSGGAAANVSG